MTLLLKINPDALLDGVAVVPRMKSALLTGDDIGATVYVWFGDAPGAPGALHSRTTLTAFEPLKMPQVHDASKLKDAYRLSMATAQERPVTTLTTRYLGPYRYVEGADGVESLGRIHRDRNDKIIRLTGAEAAVLGERFQH